MESKILFFLTAAFAVLNMEDAFSSAQSDYQSIALYYHNTYRQYHNAPPMSLDDYLNSKAQECATYYATRKAIDHTCTVSGSGENLYMGWGTSSDDLSQVVQTAVKSWYAESASYNFANPANSYGMTGHFTQLIWKQSTSLGIGAATVEGYTAVVAKYSPFGNIVDSDWSNYRANVE